MASITFDKATLHYPGNPSPTIDAMDLKVADGEFIALVGPSGSGKSTVLRMVAGLSPLASGEIYIGDEPSSNVAPSKRDVAMVFQSYALYPHMTVAENMAFALKMQKVPKEEQQRRVKEAAGLLDLHQYLERYPKALSGGQRQRVAMGRAIVRDPRVFLMDEPLSNLDAKLRVSTRSEISRLQHRLGTTMLYVTHDQTEAMTMADRIAILKDGVLQQVGTPEEVYRHPVNTFVASFIGSPSMNMLNGEVADGYIVVGDAQLKLPSRQKAAAGQKVVVGIRPEAVQLCGEADADMRSEVQFVENYGSDLFLHLSVEGGVESNDVIIRVPNTTRVERGDKLSLAVDTEALQLFSADTEEALAA
ncbi:ABC transporter ATP-binding protein [Corynebacterium otitidis]|uniref:Trehalose import ATP-binding protein SugC n=1 Tax=Corynebacterium otitidis ATCC 51513 TaxID=883169 RepID=I7KJX1_9CORY|nr:sn-glycerol-3-phosphate ABC transporter ATP-binding protein UgpC [Corynebacterium otitidis]EJZ81629.1 hypothetical protein HMPREF9719_01450 [Corynebacterium otitidis ATCC 51513]KKO83523.1 sugar ABC transporter ATP-binding protein [Corynebacterium otitidis]CCI83895.1 Maltodextrin import ATP-binding protein msmX [Corynebacterium otitidis ATCC 51513]